jgi:AcrR family transcriptional regulator
MTSAREVIRVASVARRTKEPGGGRAKPAPRHSRAELSRGEEARAHILDVALALFRENGLDGTTMRAIAQQAGVALGGAYYYFPSKEAIVLAYYEDTQERVGKRARSRFRETDDPGERVRAVLRAQIDVVASDRRLLGGLFRAVASPEDDLSVFSGRTERMRRAAIELYEEALAPALLEPALREVVALALWAAHLGTILYLVHDDSPRQARTKKLVDDAADLFASALPALPLFAATFGDKLTRALADAGLAGRSRTS